jgi:hypothetical protein
MAKAMLTLSQRSNSDHTADDFAVGQRVKAHAATDPFTRGDCTAALSTLAPAQSDWCW